MRRGASASSPSTANEVRPALSVYVHDKLAPGEVLFGLVVMSAPPSPAPPRRWPRPASASVAPVPDPAAGKSAFVYVSQKTGEPELFDFINVTPRQPPAAGSACTRTTRSAT